MHFTGQPLHDTSQANRFTILHSPTASRYFTGQPLHDTSQANRFTILHRPTASRYFTGRPLHDTSQAGSFTIFRKMSFTPFQLFHFLLLRPRIRIGQQWKCGSPLLLSGLPGFFNRFVIEGKRKPLLLRASGKCFGGNSLG